METLRPGDRVRLVADIGLLKNGSVGVVLEEYPSMPAFTTGGGAEIALEPRYSTVFPSLRLNHPPKDGPWAPEWLCYEGLHEGDVLPISVTEVEYIDNILPKSEGRDCE